MRAALYARVSTKDQDCEMQLQDLRTMAEARGVRLVGEYVDRGISGSKDRRPELDRLMTDARRRKFDAVWCWNLIALPAPSGTWSRHSMSSGRSGSTFSREGMSRGTQFHDHGILVH